MHSAHEKLRFARIAYFLGTYSNLLISRCETVARLWFSPRRRCERDMASLFKEDVHNWGVGYKNAFSESRGKIVRSYSFLLGSGLYS